MVLYKSIADKDGGRRVELSSEEEKNVRAEWAVNDRLKAEKMAEEERKIKLREQARQKLFDLLQLSAEEASLLFT